MLFWKKDFKHVKEKIRHEFSRWILTTVSGFFCSSCPCCSSSRYATDPPEEDRIIRADRIYSSCPWYIWTISTQGEKVSRVEMLTLPVKCGLHWMQLFRAIHLNCWTWIVNFFLVKKKRRPTTRYEVRGSIRR